MRPVEPVLLTRPTATCPGSILIGPDFDKRGYDVHEPIPGSGIFVLTGPHPRETRCLTVLTGPHPRETRYVTYLAADPQDDTCDCPVFDRRGRCRHVAALRQLRDEGQL
jgi:hypothetical protein